MLAKQEASHNRHRNLAKNRKKNEKLQKKLRKTVPIFAIFCHISQQKNDSHQQNCNQLFS